MRSSFIVIKNTAYLYMKMGITMVVSLYAVRIILQALGVVDYGIYNLVAGVIAMLAFLNSSMTVSTQRYLSFYLGKGQENKLKEVFKNSLINHLIIALIILLFLEIAYMFIFGDFLQIPSSRLSAAKVLYQFMIINTFLTIIAMPFDAVIIAHEDLLLDSLVGIFEAIGKLGIAYGLLLYQSDRLIMYGFLLICLTFSSRIIKFFFSRKKYQETKSFIHTKTKFLFFREMFAFGGWNLFGGLCSVSRNYGISIILNLFFGATINASYGIAYQVNGQLAAFSSNMLKALNPQIIKSEGSGDRARMIKLTLFGSKISFLLMAFFAIPLIFEMPYVLKLWLETVPDNTIIFCQLILIGTLTNQLTIGLQTAIQSTGKIRLYQSVVGSILLLNLPISYSLLYFGLPAYSVLVSFIVIEVFACTARLIISKHTYNLSLRNYFYSVLVKIIFTIVPLVSILYLVTANLDQGFSQLIIVITISSFLFISFSYVIALDEYEKIIIKNIFDKIKQKIRPA